MASLRQRIGNSGSRNGAMMRPGSVGLRGRLIALLLARDIWRPLQALTATVRRIGAGDREI